jgi:hypothetical protein
VAGCIFYASSDEGRRHSGDPSETMENSSCGGGSDCSSRSSHKSLSAKSRALRASF